MSKIVIVIRNSEVEKVFTEKEEVDVEIINYDTVSSLKERMSNDRKVKSLELESTKSI